MMRASLSRLLDTLSWRLSTLLPRRLAYHCAIRVWAHGTTGRWGNTEVPALTCCEALRRWELPGRAPGRPSHIAPEPENPT